MLTDDNLSLSVVIIFCKRRTAMSFENYEDYVALLGLCSPLDSTISIHFDFELGERGKGALASRLDKIPLTVPGSYWNFQRHPPEVLNAKLRKSRSFVRELVEVSAGSQFHPHLVPPENSKLKVAAKRLNDPEQ